LVFVDDVKGLVESLRVCLKKVPRRNVSTKDYPTLVLDVEGKASPPPMSQDSKEGKYLQELCNHFLEVFTKNANFTRRTHGGSGLLRVVVHALLDFIFGYPEELSFQGVNKFQPYAVVKKVKEVDPIQKLEADQIKAQIAVLQKQLKEKTTPRSTTPRSTTPRSTTPRSTTPLSTTPRSTTSPKSMGKKARKRSLLDSLSFSSEEEEGKKKKKKSDPWYSPKKETVSAKKRSRSSDSDDDAEKKKKLENPDPWHSPKKETVSEQENDDVEVIDDDDEDDETDPTAAHYMHPPSVGGTLLAKVKDPEDCICYFLFHDSAAQVIYCRQQEVSIGSEAKVIYKKMTRAVFCRDISKIYTRDGAVMKSLVINQCVDDVYRPGGDPDFSLDESKHQEGDIRKLLDVKVKEEKTEEKKQSVPVPVIVEPKNTPGEEEPIDVESDDAKTDPQGDGEPKDK